MFKLFTNMLSSFEKVKEEFDIERKLNKVKIKSIKFIKALAPLSRAPFIKNR